jgi:predicted HTH transcriptional regulator
MGLNERQIKAVMYVKEKTTTRLSSFKTIAPEVSIKRYIDDLQDLVSKGVLKEIGEKKGKSMNWRNRHFLDISDTFRTFIGLLERAVS